MWRSLVVVMLLASVAQADDFESKPETYGVNGELGMHIDVTYMTLTGTYHWATKLDIHTAKATLVREQPELEGSPQLPLMEKAIAIDPKRWLLVGWSSYGAGMETMAAWIVAANGKRLRVTDELYWTSDRSHAGFAIEDDKGKIRIGIPERPGEAHNRGDWELHIGTKAVAFEKLKYAKATTKLFAPPMDEARDLTRSSRGSPRAATSSSLQHAQNRTNSSKIPNTTSNGPPILANRIHVSRHDLLCNAAGIDVTPYAIDVAHNPTPTGMIPSRFTYMRAGVPRDRIPASGTCS